jgi:hypothetical protein
MANSQYAPGGTCTGFGGTLTLYVDPIRFTTVSFTRSWSKLMLCVAPPNRIIANWAEGSEMSSVTSKTPSTAKVVGAAKIAGRTAGEPEGVNRYGGVIISKSGWF